MKVNVTPIPGGNEITVRKGQALEPKADKSINISGTLGAPFQFLSGRGIINQERAHLKIYKDKGKLELVLQDTDPYTTHIIEGSLKRDTVLESFKINSDSRWSNAEFMKFIRTMKFYFPDKGQHEKLIQSLQKWSVGIQRVIKDHNDHSGNSNFQLETKIQDLELLRKFTIEVPIFQGYAKHKFTVEIGLDPKAVSVDIYLISDELMELEISVREKLIDSELQNFQANTFSKVIIS